MAYDLGRLVRFASLALVLLGAGDVARAATPARAAATECAKIAQTPAPDEFPAPYAAIVVDANARVILHADKADELRHPASLTKVMTLYLLFEKLEAGAIKLDTQMPVSLHATCQEPTKLDLAVGDTLSVQDAIYGLVTQSANDAAVVVAEALAGDEGTFAAMMTAKARKLGMDRTVYRNASGLPDDAQVTSARDQAILGIAMQERFPNFYPVFASKAFTFRGRRYKNHNHLLGRLDGMDGIKTGYIRSSKFNLLASVKRNDRHVVAVVMGGASARKRDARMRVLVDAFIPRATPRTMIASARSAKGRAADVSDDKPRR